MVKISVTLLELRKLIIKLRNEDNFSIGDISKIVEKSKSVIHSILRKLEETVSFEAGKPPGRSRKTSARVYWLFIKKGSIYYSNRCL